MLLHRTHKTPSALNTVIVATPTSFPVHDLGADIGRARRGFWAEEPKLAPGAIPGGHRRGIRTPELPFAAPLLFHPSLAAV